MLRLQHAAQHTFMIYRDMTRKNHYIGLNHKRRYIAITTSKHNHEERLSEVLINGPPLQYIVQHEGQNQKQKTTALPIYCTYSENSSQGNNVTGGKNFTTKHGLSNGSTNVLVS